MTPTRTAAEAAETLTKAQRDSIYPGPGNPAYARGPLSAMRVLERIGVVKDIATWSTQGKRGAELTPFGAEVRAIFAAQEPSNADA